MSRLKHSTNGGFPTISQKQSKEEKATMLKKLAKDGSRVKFEMDIPIKTAVNLPYIYMPRLHRQKTDKDPESEMGNALQSLSDFIGLDSETSLPLKMARTEAKNLIVTLVRTMRNERNSFEFKHPILVDCYPHWKQEDKEIAYLFPVTIPRIRVDLHQPGCVLVRLPDTEHSTPSESSSKQQHGIPRNGTPHINVEELRAKDGVHLSLKKTYIMFSKLIKRILKNTGVVVERIRVGHNESGYFLTVDLLNYGWTGWKLQIIPAICAKTKMFLIPKIFFTGESVPSDVHWRVSWIAREMEILTSVSVTDKGSRLRALDIVCKMCQTDWRLADLSSYNIQTALLHDMDYTVDHSPRWQRFTLENCVKSLLNRLLIHVRRGSLPHFLIEGIDLFELVNPRRLVLWKSALERLTSSDSALLSLVVRSSSEEDQGKLTFPKFLDI